MKVIFVWIIAGYCAAAAAFYTYIAVTAQPEFPESKRTNVVDVSEQKRQQGGVTKRAA